MAEVSGEDTVEGAAARLDRALARLEGSVRNLGSRWRSVAKAESDLHRLMGERSRLATELDKTTAKAKRLDDSAHQVSVRLVEAMETIRSVLDKQGGRDA